MTSTDDLTMHDEWLAANILAARERAGLTQQRLAEQVGVTVGVVSRWERAQTRPLHRNMAAIARILDKPVAWFYTPHQQEPAA